MAYPYNNPHVDPNGVGYTAPAIGAAAVTPSDSADLPRIARALYIGVSGNVSVICEDGGAAVTFSNLSAGQILPLRVKRVRSTSTTATSIVALY
mgnify:CR=1 FL=1